MNKQMSISKFRKLGYLQELNRQFLHPLGLALEVFIDSVTGEEGLGGIWDCRDEPNGVVFDRVDAWKAIRIIELQRQSRHDRVEHLGYFIQPIGTFLHE